MRLLVGNRIVEEYLIEIEGHAIYWVVVCICEFIACDRLDWEVYVLRDCFTNGSESF